MTQKWWYGLKIFFGAEICPQCGSANISTRGFKYENRRHVCKDCGKESYIFSLGM